MTTEPSTREYIYELERRLDAAVEHHNKAEEEYEKRLASLSRQVEELTERYGVQVEYADELEKELADARATIQRLRENSPTCSSGDRAAIDRALLHQAREGETVMPDTVMISRECAQKALRLLRAIYGDEHGMVAELEAALRPPLYCRRPSKEGK